MSSNFVIDPAYEFDANKDYCDLNAFEDNADDTWFGAFVPLLAVA